LRSNVKSQILHNNPWGRIADLTTTNIQNLHKTTNRDVNTSVEKRGDGGPQAGEMKTSRKKGKGN